MQDTSDLYKRIFKDKHHTSEVRVFINDTEYSEQDVFSVKTTSSLFSSDSPTIGSCVAKEIDLQVKKEIQIPKLAKIALEVRIKSPEIGTSEWIKKGVFYKDTAETEQEVTKIHGYDSMLKTETPFLTTGAIGEFPRKEILVVQEIVNRLDGVVLNSETETLLRQTNYDVPYPNQMTDREVLSNIASCHAGNWIITDINELKLILFGRIPKETNYLITEYGEPISFGGVRILV